MESQQDIIIIPGKFEPSRKQEYARVDPGAAEDLPSPPGMLSHHELVKLKENADHKKRAARKRKTALGVVLLIALTLLAAGLYASVQIVKPDSPQIKQGGPEGPVLTKPEAKQQQETAQKPIEQPAKVKEQAPVNAPKAEAKPIAAPAKPPAPPELKPAPPTTPPSRLPQLIPIEIPVTAGSVGEHSPSREHGGHAPATFPYPTLGMPAPNTAFNATQVKHGRENYEYEKAMDELFKPYNDTDCQLERYGDEGDGGYLLCRNLMGETEGLINLGVEGRDLFGCGVSSQFLIPNYQYDCTNSVAPHCGSNAGLNRFEGSCLSAQTERVGPVAFLSLADMVRERNLTGRHVSMKIDVEGAEWPGLRTFPVADLRWVDQLVLEIHLSAGSIGHPQVWGNLDSLRSLAKEFVSVSLHMNNYACVSPDELHQQTRFYPSFAVEVTLVNRRLITLHRPTRSYALHPQDRPNRGGPDCQLRDP